MMLIELFYPLAINFHPKSNFASKEDIEKLINKTFFDFNFREYNNCYYMDVFNIEPIRPLNMSSDKQYSVFKFWIALSLYRKINNYENYYIPTDNFDFNINYFNSYIHTIKSLKNEIKNIEHVFFYNVFDIDYEELIIFFNNYNLYLDKLIVKIKNLKEQEILNSKLSIKKIETFKNDFIEKFNRIPCIKNIFKNIDLFNDQKDMINNNIFKIELKKIDMKEAFLDISYTGFSKWGERYTKEVAINEDLNLIFKISKSCKEKNLDEMDKILKLENKNYIILAINRSNSYFYNSNNFKPKWNINDINSKYKKINSFYGYYNIFDRKTPVFWIPRLNLFDENATSLNPIIILNTKKLGKLIQYYPLDSKSNDDENFLIDYFYIKIDQVENYPEFENLVKNPPSWLREKGNEEDRKTFLKSRVYVEIWEKFELKLADDFEGYKFNYIYNPQI